MSVYGTLANNAEPDQTPHRAASDQILHCLLTECIFDKIVNYYPTTLKFEMDSSNCKGREFQLGKKVKSFFCCWFGSRNA